MNWTYWAIVAAAVIHVAEEYRGGFLTWFPKFSGMRIAMEQFVIVNALFVLLCITAALVPGQAIVLKLSVAALIFVNACIHIIGTVRFRRYSPGLVSALLLYMPLAFYAYYRSAAEGRLSVEAGVGAFALSLVWHAIPFVSYFFERNVVR